MLALRIVLVLLFAAAPCFRADAADDRARRVIVLANASDAESLRLARHYMERRQIPEANLLALPMPPAETISWRQFVDQVYQPAQDELVKRGWIDAIGSTLTDSLGRKRYSISGHKISYLVVCRGVPLRIEDDPKHRDAPASATGRPGFRTNCAAVDSELALLVQSGYPIDGMVPNPLFNRAHPSFLEEGKVVKVSRLDGPSYSDAAALVDNALKAERDGLIGRAYVDIGGLHPEGDRWLEDTVHLVDALNFDMGVDRQPQTMAITARFDAPVLYFGWYAGNINGPFLKQGFRFPPGAIALHIHSFSAHTLRTNDAGWCGPLVARGVTATFGNVYEPYLPFTHRPQILVNALVAGKTLGDAACLAIPVLSWQAIVLGDPLYRPFAVSFAEQWQRRHELGDDAYAYVVIREINRLIKEGQVDKAAATAKDALKERHHLALAWKAAQLVKPDEAQSLLSEYVSMPNIPESLVSVAAEIALFFQERGAATDAVALYRKLLATEGLSSEEKVALLKPAMKAAESAGAAETLDLWRGMYEALNPAPAKK